MTWDSKRDANQPQRDYKSYKELQNYYKYTLKELQRGGKRLLKYAIQTQTMQNNYKQMQKEMQNDYK